MLDGKFNKIGTKYTKGNFTDLHKNVNGFKKSFRPRTKSVVDVNGHLQRISCANYWICLRINDVRKTEIQTTEPLVGEPNAFDVEMANEVLKDINKQILIKFQQIWLKQDVEVYVLR